MKRAFFKSVMLLVVLHISGCAFFEESFNERALKFKENAEKNSKDYEIKFIAEIAGRDKFIIFDKNDTIGMGNKIRIERKTRGAPECTEIYIKSKDVEHILSLTIDCISSEQKLAVP